MEDHDKLHADKTVQHVAFEGSAQGDDQHVPHRPEQPLHSSAPTSPLHHQHQHPMSLQPWLMPHPNLSISWHNNDRASSEMSLVDQQGHESDPSELLRPPVLFRNSHDLLPRLMRPSTTAMPSEQDLLAIPQQPRTRRSMSLSLARPSWHSAGGRYDAEEIPSPSDHAHTNEIVPYSQEWRVILRSPPRGRTVLYNPEMQSLVVQTTIGRNAHSGMPLQMEESDRSICALCRRPLDPDTAVDEEDASLAPTSFMDSNYFRLLAEANQVIPRRSTLQAPLRPPSTSNTPTSSSRTSLDLDGILENERDRPSSPSLHDPPPLSHDALNQGYYERFFVEQVKLGKGFRGSVFLCQHILDGVFLGEYAIKKVAIGDNHDWLVQMLREVHLLERLHHPNIVSYKHAWLENHRLTKFGPEVACLFILMECANGGNLEEYIETLSEREMAGNGGGPSHAGSSSSSPGHPSDITGVGDTTEPKKPLSARERILQERRKQAQAASSPPNDSSGSKAPLPQHFLPISEVWCFFFDICEGLAHLHRLGIIHRDLKPPNLLLSYSDHRVKGSKGERPRVLISDFGECEVLDQAAKRDRTGATGTLEFLAPELLQVDEHGRYMNEFSFKGDMWSLGMILYYLCYSRLPYSQIDDVDILKEEIRGFRSISLPSDGPNDRVVPEELKILIKMLLSTDKSKRPSCDEILMTLAPQRERMARGGNGTQKPDQASAQLSSKGTMTSMDDPTADISVLGTSSTTTAPSSVEVNTIVRRGSRSRHTIQESQQRPLHHTSQQHLSASSSRLPGIRAPNKRVKPLGLGLRHMLRRRMMHHPSTEAFYHTAESSSLRGRHPYISERYPLQGGSSRQYHGAPARSTLGDTVVSAASYEDDHLGREHERGVKSASSVSLESTSRRTEGRRGSSRAMEESKGSDGAKNRGRRKKIQGSSEERDRSGRHFERTSANSNRLMTRSRSSTQEAKDKDVKDTSDGMARAEPCHTVSSPSSSYWSTLADHHSQYQGRGQNGLLLEDMGKKRGPQTNFGGHLADSDESGSSDRAGWQTNPVVALAADSGAGIGRGISGYPSLTLRRRRRRHRASRSRNAQSASDDVTEDEEDYTIPRRETLEQAFDKRSESSTSSTEEVKGEEDEAEGEEGENNSRGRHDDVAPWRAMEGPPLAQRQDGIWQGPLSTVIMFASLLARIWFCQQICYPITVRPMVLYPILTLTMVWDRYLLVILAGGGGSNGSSGGARPHRPHRHHHHHTLHSEPETDLGQARLAHDKRRRRRRASDELEASESSVAGDGYARDHEDDGDVEDEGEKLELKEEEEVVDEHGADDLFPMVHTTAMTMVGSYGDTQMLMAMDRADDTAQGGEAGFGTMVPSLSLFWGAFAVGVAVQLTWVVGVWMASGGQLCVAP